MEQEIAHALVWQGQMDALISPHNPCMSINSKEAFGIEEYSFSRPWPDRSGPRSVEHDPSESIRTLFGNVCLALY